MSIRNTNMGGTDFQDSGTALLSANINSTTATIGASPDTSGFKSVGAILIGSELIDYGSTVTAQFQSCTRGQYNTTATAHLQSATISEREPLKSADMNDTFDELYDRLTAFPVFWLNDNLKTTYDDFDSETTGAFSGNSKWSISTSGGGTAAIVESTNASGKGTKELRLTAHGDGTSASVQAKALTLTKNRSYHVFCYWKKLAGPSGTTGVPHYVQVTACGGGYHQLGTLGVGSSNTGSAEGNADIFIHNTATDTYDLYVGGKLVESDMSSGTANLDFNVQYNGTSHEGTDTLYIDLVEESNP